MGTVVDIAAREVIPGEAHGLRFWHIQRAQNDGIAFEG
ncbi:hypothetical protein IAD21_03305 [Abditibacteriota bacterium]|nr:hypothetical protein IAD21_03305 [Abditibacteriota bacterium]